jgi:hypothetical protein
MDASPLSHLIHCEGGLCSVLFSFHIPRFAFIPSIAWPWLCECWCLLLGFGMMGCTRKKWAKCEGGYLDKNDKDEKNHTLPLLSMKLGTQSTTDEDERNCHPGIVTLCMVMAWFEAIFWQVQKILHNSFKNRTFDIGLNRTFDIGLPPPKCMKSNVFRHEKL